MKTPNGKTGVIIRSLVTVFFVLCPLVLNPFGFDVFALPRAFFLYLTALTVILFVLLSLGQQKGSALKYNPLQPVFASFLFFIVLSAVLARDRYTAWWGFDWDYEGLFAWLAYSVFFFAGYRYFRKKESFAGLVHYLSYPAIVVGLYAVLQYALDWQLMDWFQRTEIRRASSFLGHPSYLGLYAVLTIPLFFSAAKNGLYGRRERLTVVLGLIFSLAGLVLSFSRGAWLAFALVVSVCLIGHFRKLTRYLYERKISAIVILAVTIVLAWSLRSQIGEIGLVRSVGQRAVSIVDRSTATLQVRSAIYRQSTALLKEKWLLGVGPDNYAYAITPYFERGWHTFNEQVVDKAHNLFLDYWLSFGLGGIISFTLLIVAWFYCLAKTYILSGGQNRNIIGGIALSVAGYLAGLQFHYTTVELAPLFWFLLGYGSYLMVEAGVLKEREVLISWPFEKQTTILRQAGAGLVLLALALTAYYGYQRLSADISFRRAMNATDPGLAIGWLEKSCRKSPHAANYYLALNLYYLEAAAHSDANDYRQKGVDILIAAIRHIPLDYRLPYRLGDTYLQIIDFALNKDYIYEQAKTAYLETAKLYPNDYQTSLKLGVVSAYQNDSVAAKEYWEQCLALNPAAGQCYYNLYALYDRVGNKEMAEKFYAEYLKVNGL